MGFKKCFTRENWKKKSIQHLSRYCTATAVCNNGDDVELIHQPRSLKEITFIKVSPTIFELEKKVVEKPYLTSYYKFVLSNEFSLCDVLDEYMTENYSTEYWEIIMRHPYLTLYCSCVINISHVGKKRNVFVNKYYYDYSRIGFVGMHWFRHIWKDFVNEDFHKIISNGPDRESLNDMLIKQLSIFCRKSRHISIGRRYLLAYDVFFCVFKSVVIDRCFKVCLCI